MPGEIGPSCEEGVEAVAQPETGNGPAAEYNQGDHSQQRKGQKRKTDRNGQDDGEERRSQNSDRACGKAERRFPFGSDGDSLYLCGQKPAEQQDESGDEQSPKESLQQPNQEVEEKIAPRGDVLFLVSGRGKLYNLALGGGLLLCISREFLRFFSSQLGQVAGFFGGVFDLKANRVQLGPKV